MRNDRSREASDLAPAETATSASPDDLVFREAMQGVRRFSASVPELERPKPPAEARFTRADHAEVLVESLGPLADPALLETGDELVFRRHHVPESVLRRLRRGAYVVEAEIDLHGLTAVEARAALQDFVAAAGNRGMRCIRVIHGKGRRSGPRGPILKNVVNQWLRRSDRVLAFGSARQVDGGSGAVYVLLAQS